MDVTLRHDGKLPSGLTVATFGDNELLDSLQCPVLAVARRHRDVVERVLEIVPASLDEPRKSKSGLTHIKRSLYRRGVLSYSQATNKNIRQVNFSLARRIRDWTSICLK